MACVNVLVDKVLKIMVVGAGAVGKTASCYMFTRREFRDDFKLTIGVEFHNYQSNICDTEVKVQFWDLAGQDAFGFIRAPFYRGAVGLVLMVDLTRPDSLEKAESYLTDEILLCAEQMKLRCVAVVGNKTDLAELITVDDAQLSELTQSVEATLATKALCLKTSAKNFDSVQQMFRQLIECIIKRWET
jgi:small GTP-binding protein